MQWRSGSINEIIAEAIKDNKLFLLYIEGDNETSETMTGTFNDPSASEKLESENVIAVKFADKSVPYLQFCKIYPVTVIPSTFFFGGNNTLIGIILGSLTPAEFCSEVDKMLEVHKESRPNLQPASDSAENTGTHNAASSSSTRTADESQPSTSSAAPNSEPSSTNQSLEDEVERATVLMEDQRQTKSVEEVEKERNDEIARRNMEEAMQQVQLTKRKTEFQEWAENLAKEKEEDRLAREKIKTAIAQDRAEQAAKDKASKAPENAERKRIQQKQEEKARREAEAAVNGDEACLRFRLPDGSSFTSCFSADTTLEEAIGFVREEILPPSSDFSVHTTFPTRHFSESDYPKSLRNLQLVPSAVLLIDFRINNQSNTDENNNTCNGNSTQEM